MLAGAYSVGRAAARARIRVFAASSSVVLSLLRCRSGKPPPRRTTTVAAVETRMPFALMLGAPSKAQPETASGAPVDVVVTSTPTVADRHRVLETRE